MSPTTSSSPRANDSPETSKRRYKVASRYLAEGRTHKQSWFLAFREVPRAQIGTSTPPTSQPSIVVSQCSQASNYYSAGATSWTSGVVSSRLVCQVCNYLNSMADVRCEHCRTDLPGAATKLKILLKRVQVVQSKGAAIDATVVCQVCETLNVMADAVCRDPDCNESLPNDAEKLRIVVRRIELVKHAPQSA
ncbi:hypothetical protein SPRG_20544 [Saprolegnia parasitica CBS 223.65]|uniref:Uncharacterized protein n=1 Tax=Saprolegnia parasitica (strain CBS 223.65) TaxID=695850 RepID=A0A067CJP4_SAPPC|nr:hypothetical protein SPRG_20544 [Saprolegnia parasitica CBS 223.65]KDO26746.1 hypothetical protein SPRG_20544 [Saprolegnia parasitica CBS 223.65]|eukprot:XP_012202626.1 hypothetical protein SPRG_20544 [Saprolegnia parasitica CBS 223.65]